MTPTWLGWIGRRTEAGALVIEKAEQQAHPGFRVDRQAHHEVNEFFERRFSTSSAPPSNGPPRAQTRHASKLLRARLRTAFAGAFMRRGHNPASPGPHSTPPTHPLTHSPTLCARARRERRVYGGRMGNDHTRATHTHTCTRTHTNAHAHTLTLTHTRTHRPCRLGSKPCMRGFMCSCCMGVVCKREQTEIVMGPWRMAWHLSFSVAG